MEVNNAVIDLSSDSSSPPSPAGSTEQMYDRITALINKYKCEGTAADTKEKSDFDEETVLVSDHDEDKNSVDSNFEDKLSGKHKNVSSLRSLDFRSSKNGNKRTIRKIESISDSDESVSAGTTVTQGASESGGTSTGSSKSMDFNVESDESFEAYLNRAAKHSNAQRDSPQRLETISDSDESITIQTTSKKKRKTENTTNSEKPSKKKRDSMDKESRRLAKLAEQQKKKEEREQKKQEAMREKSLKRALNAANKNIKPNECIKFVTVHIDPGILNESYGTEILTHLHSIEARYKIEAQKIPHSVTWKRETQTHLMDDNGQLVLSSEVTDTQDVLLFMDWKTFVNHVHERSLLAHVKSVQSVYENRRFYLGIFGLEAYFKYTKSRKRKDLIEKEQSQRSSKLDKIYAGTPFITQRNVEYALTELQLLCNCCCRMVESAQDVALMVGQFSKAIAQLPYKQEKNLKYQECDWYMAGDKRDTVGVDKDGNGLQRLWHQQLCCFPLARLETAEAIASRYPTPVTLVQAYEECTSKEEAEKLLQDIPIRRAAGPMTTVRKIGPELSKKAYTFFMSADENALL